MANNGICWIVDGVGKKVFGAPTHRWERAIFGILRSENDTAPHHHYDEPPVLLVAAIVHLPNEATLPHRSGAASYYFFDFRGNQTGVLLFSLTYSRVLYGHVDVWFELTEGMGVHEFRVAAAELRVYGGCGSPPLLPSEKELDAVVPFPNEDDTSRPSGETCRNSHTGLN